MKKTVIIMFGSVAIGFGMCAEPKPKADVHLRITSDLPQLGISARHNGIFSVTNTGEIAFTVVTGGEWAFSTIRFYEEGGEAWQQDYHKSGKGKQREMDEREEAIASIAFCLERGYPNKILLPGESVSFKLANFSFPTPPGEPRGLYKAEMYLGHDTWVPVHITPTIYPLEVVAGSKEFFYSKEGTNQWLYVKTDDDKFKRVSKMKFDSRPLRKDDTVTFEALDGTKKKLTREQARQIINEARN